MALAQETAASKQSKSFGQLIPWGDPVRAAQCCARVPG